MKLRLILCDDNGSVFAECDALESDLKHKEAENRLLAPLLASLKKQIQEAHRQKQIDKSLAIKAAKGL